jgi:Tfp pilus assembly protein PilF
MKPVAIQSASLAIPSTVSAQELSIPQAARNLVASGRKKIYADRNPRAGLKDFQKALVVTPAYYEAYYEMAMPYLILGAPDDAEKSLRKSVEVSHDTYGDADVGLGMMLIDRAKLRTVKSWSAIALS